MGILFKIDIKLSFTAAALLSAILLWQATGNEGSLLMGQPLPFVRYQNVEVATDEGYPMLGAWQGGLNAPQFGQIDIDQDGQQDLLVFDRSGNKILPYLYRQNDADCASPLLENNYCFAPDYATVFPALHDWVQVVNWDNMPPNDLLTYGTAGISLYLGSYDSNTGQLQFQLRTNALRYQGLTGALNIPANTIERPALVDVNNDGDVDVLNFDFSGVFVEYFENQSQELTQTPADTVWFLRQSKCWGHFKEDPNSAEILLNEFCSELMPPSSPDSMLLRSTALPNGKGDISPKVQFWGDNTILSSGTAIQPKQPLLLHSGSTLLAWDMDNDQDQDLWVGDISGRHLTFLLNGGNAELAHMTASDPLFPSYNIPLDIYRFPAAMLADIDNDGLPDMLAAPNGLDLQSNDQIWYYRNIGDSDSAVFALQTSRFLEAEMIDVGINSYPAWADYDADGLPDLFVGNYGYLDTADLQHHASLALFRNVGTPENPAFAPVSTDFGQLSQYNFRGIYPAFADMDGDGDADMIAGDDDGFLHYFRNMAPAGEPMALEAWQLAFAEGAGTGAAVPCLWPLTAGNPNQYDIVVGEKAGKVNLFQNTSTSGDLLEVQLVNSFWGQVDVRTIGNPFGYSAPAIARLDTSDSSRLFLLVNSESGRLFVYTDLDQPVFTPVTDLTSGIGEGGHGGLALADLNGDGAVEMVVGNQRGGLGLFAQMPVSSTAFHEIPPLTQKGGFVAWAVQNTGSTAPTATIHLQLPAHIIGNMGECPLSVGLISILGQEIARTCVGDDAWGFNQTNEIKNYEWQLPYLLPTGLFLVQLIDGQGRKQVAKLLIVG